MEIEELRKDTEFYKKRFETSQKEREVFKKENQALRQELNSMKDFVKKLVIPKKGMNIKSPEHGVDKTDMITILGFQRNRIEELEKENEELKRKYEKILFEKEKEEDKRKPASVLLVEKSLSAEAALEKANERISLLENKLREMTVNYSKEVSTLKNRLVESQASEVLSAEMRPNSGDIVNLLGKSGSLSSLGKRDGRLEPVRTDKVTFLGISPLLRSNNNQNLANFNQISSEQSSELFNYNKRNLSRQKI